MRIAGAALAIVAFVLVMITRVQLGKAFSVRPEAKQLVTSGIYSRIRNPMYVFVDLAIAGVILAVGLYWLFALLAAFAAFQARQARREAKVLQDKFGRAYLDYRKQTWF